MDYYLWIGFLLSYNRRMCRKSSGLTVFEIPDTELFIIKARRYICCA